uniref:Uncharacterized protein n=1 Tax=Rhizophora mucronata TaxID=61149 RepID=A0A2P2Q6C5_RHIMU
MKPSITLAVMLSYKKLGVSFRPAVLFFGSQLHY